MAAFPEALCVRGPHAVLPVVENKDPPRLVRRGVFKEAEWLAVAKFRQRARQQTQLGGSARAPRRSSSLEDGLGQASPRPRNASFVSAGGPTEDWPMCPAALRVHQAQRGLPAGPPCSSCSPTAAPAINTKPSRSRPLFNAPLGPDPLSPMSTPALAHARSPARLQPEITGTERMKGPCKVAPITVANGARATVLSTSFSAFLAQGEREVNVGARDQGEFIKHGVFSQITREQCLLLPRTSTVVREEKMPVYVD